MISNCGKNEYGGATGGQPGDQTGQEYWNIGWYNFNPNVVYRHTNSKLRVLIAELASDAADNNCIGYDQTTRTSFYEQLKTVSWQPKAIETACAADCSSSTAAIILAAANILKKEAEESGDDGLLSVCNRIIKSVSPYDTTVSLNESLPAAGFIGLTESRYLTSDKYLLPGDIILNIVNHVAINLSTGANAAKEEQSIVIITPSTTTETTAITATESDAHSGYYQIQNGSGMNNPQAIVKVAQLLLSMHGYSCTADGEFGNETEAAVKRFQTDNGLESDGVISEDEWKALILFPV